MTDDKITPEEHVLLSISHLLNITNSLESDFEGCVTDKEKYMLLKIEGFKHTLSDIEKILERSFGTDYDTVKAKIKFLKEKNKDNDD